MLEGEVLHVAVNAGQLPILEDWEPDVQHAVLVLRVLHDQEETEVARLPGAHHRLAHLLLALVEDAAAVGDYDKQLGDGEASGGLTSSTCEERGGEVKQAHHTRLLLLKPELALDSSTCLCSPLLVEAVHNLCLGTKPEGDNVKALALTIRMVLLIEPE